MPGVAHRQHRYLNNRAENSHQPTRERERRMRRFKSARHAQRFVEVHGIVSRAASLPFAAHPHMLRHACGYALADQGADTRLIQDFLGHRKIEHTVKYTATNPARFERLWR